MAFIIYLVMEDDRDRIIIIAMQHRRSRRNRSYTGANSLLLLVRLLLKLNLSQILGTLRRACNQVSRKRYCLPPIAKNVRNLVTHARLSI